MEFGEPGYFTWQTYPFRRPPELSGGTTQAEVCVVGAGPVGLAAALTLARLDVRVVLLEARDSVSENSRTIAVSRRSAQILDRLGLAERFRGLAGVRERNHVFSGDRCVHTAAYERSPHEKWPDTSSLQQPWTEHILLEAVLAHPLIDLRWRSEVVSVDDTDPGRVSLGVRTPAGDYTIAADWVIASDGARSAVKRCLGLEYEPIGAGTSGRRFVICDFEMKTRSPYARRLLLNPPYKPGSVAILHRQPFDTWRLDWAIDDDEDIDEQTRPEVVARRVEAQVAMLDDPTAEKDRLKIVWISGYTPRALSLPDYRHGRVFFAGDAAHQTPIFGGRGMNQGLLDQANLCWRLAYVIRGHADPAILDRYDLERRPVIVRNLMAVEQATLFMSTPTRGIGLMRQAVLDLMPTEPFVLGLADAFAAARAESLLTPPPETDPPVGAAVGSPLPDARVTSTAGTPLFLHDLLSPGAFVALCFTGIDPVPPALQDTLASLHAAGPPFTYTVVARRPVPGCAAIDEAGTAFERLAVREGDVLLVRPDGYVCARMSNPDAAALRAALRDVLGPN